MASLLTRATIPVSCYKTDSHGNVINLDKGTITFAGHPRIVALISFIVVTIFLIANLTMMFWSWTNLPPKQNSHDLRSNKWTSIAVLWFILYLIADATLRFIQYYWFEFPIEVMLTELARVKPLGLAEYFSFVAILRCNDVFAIGNFSHTNGWRRGRLLLLGLLTLVDLVSTGADYYVRISMAVEISTILDKSTTEDDCTYSTTISRLSCWASILFYVFALVCCVFFTFIVVKLRSKRIITKSVQQYRLFYTVVITAFWTHCIQCLIGTLVLDQFGINSTQTTDFIYVVVYDINFMLLLLFLLKLKKLDLDPNQCHYQPAGCSDSGPVYSNKTGAFVTVQPTATTFLYENVPGAPYGANTYPPVNNSQFAANSQWRQTPSTTYTPVNQFDYNGR